MRFKIRRCHKCGQYTLKEQCPVCKAPTVNPQPPRFSPSDTYGRYRRLIKKQAREKENREKGE